MFAPSLEPTCNIPDGVARDVSQSCCLHRPQGGNGDLETPRPEHHSKGSALTNRGDTARQTWSALPMNKLRRLAKGKELVSGRLVDSQADEYNRVSRKSAMPRTGLCQQGKVRSRTPPRLHVFLTHCKISIPGKSSRFQAHRRSYGRDFGGQQNNRKPILRQRSNDRQEPLKIDRFNNVGAAAQLVRLQDFLIIRRSA
jgi:hypothetical protein